MKTSFPTHRITQDYDPNEIPLITSEEFSVDVKVKRPLNVKQGNGMVMRHVEQIETHTISVRVDWRRLAKVLASRVLRNKDGTAGLQGDVIFAKLVR